MDVEGELRLRSQYRARRWSRDQLSLLRIVRRYRLLHTLLLGPHL
jgi:hypothetical protein